MITDLLLRIALAGALGGLIGIERQLRSKEAGLRTHIRLLVALEQLRLRPINLSVTQKTKQSDASCELTMEVTLSPRKSLDKVYATLLAIEGIQQLDIK